MVSGWALPLQFKLIFLKQKPKAINKWLFVRYGQNFSSKHKGKKITNIINKVSRNNSVGVVQKPRETETEVSMPNS